MIISIALIVLVLVVAPVVSAVSIYNSSGTAKMDTEYAEWGPSSANADVVALVDPVLFTPVRSYHDAGFTTSTGANPGNCGGWHTVKYN